MKCPVCVKEDAKSLLRYMTGRMTLMGGDSYYDEEGNYHSHDPNITSDSYECSKGHKFIINRTRGCVSCKKPDTEEIVIHGEPPVL